MQQLGKFTYELCGAPEYHEDGSFASVCPLRIPDADAMLRKTQSDDGDDSPVFGEIGPFTNAQEYLLSSLGQRQLPEDRFSQGIHKLLKLFIKWIPADLRTPPFVLMHDDLDIQNILVQDDGSLAAIIDWDGIAAAPRCVGNEKLPSWLTRDWDPTMYGHGAMNEKGEPYIEDSPAELARYRSMYVEFMRELAGDDADDITTGRSLLVDNLYIAACDPICTDEIVAKVFRECVRARCWQRKMEGSHTREEDDVPLYEFATELEDGEFNAEQLSIVKDGFMALCAELDDLEGEFWIGTAKAGDDVKTNSNWSNE